MRGPPGGAPCVFFGGGWEKGLFFVWGFGGGWCWVWLVGVWGFGGSFFFWVGFVLWPEKEFYSCWTADTSPARHTPKGYVLHSPLY